MKKAPRIGFMGDLTADVYLPKGDIRLGGAALNGAIWAKRLGARPMIFSAIGSDVAGKKFPTGVGIQKKRGRTSCIEIFLKEGERQYGKWNPGVLATYHLRVKDKQLLRLMDAIVVTVYPPYEHILTEIGLVKNKLCVVNYGDLKEFDSNLDVVIRHMKMADLLVFGLDKDVNEKLINEIRDLARAYKKMAMVTLGKYGSIVWHNDQSFSSTAKHVHAVDTTGAGDSFLTAFLVSYLQTRDIQRSLQVGTELATQVIQKVGAY